MNNKNTSQIDWINSLQFRINCISIFILIHEIFEDEIEENIRYFYWTGFYCESGKYKEHIDPEYEELIKGNKMKNLINWCVKNKIFNEDDCVTLEKIKKARNHYVHKFYDMLIFDGSFDISLLQDLVSLFNKFDNWWIKNVEAPTDVNTSPNAYLDLAHSYNCIIINAIVKSLLNGEKEVFDKLFDMISKGENDYDVLKDLLYTPKIKL